MPQPSHTLPGARLPADADGRRLLRLEVIVLLLSSFAASGVYAVLDLLRDLTKRQPLNTLTTTLNASHADNRTIDLLYQLAGVFFGVVPVLLVAYLLLRNGERFSDIGFDIRQPLRDLGRGTALAAVIGASGLALYVAAHAAGLAVTVVPENLPVVWWRIPVLVLSATQNALAEEVIVVGYLLRRLNFLGWRFGAALAASALLRGSYHLYQGFGAFVGNAVMGVIFVLLATRWQRVAPLFLAHALIDIAAFVGYAELAGHVSWLPT